MFVVLERSISNLSWAYLIWQGHFIVNKQLMELHRSINFTSHTKPFLSNLDRVISSTKNVRCLDVTESHLYVTTTDGNYYANQYLFLDMNSQSHIQYVY